MHSSTCGCMLEFKLSNRSMNITRALQYNRTKNQRLECHATIAIPTVLLGYRKNGEVTTIGLYVVARYVIRTK